MVSSSSNAAGNEPLPLHELMSRILAPPPAPTSGLNRLLPSAGTLQSWNQRLVNSPPLDFVNYVLRGVGQVIFVNNPISGALILLALYIQSPWVGLMATVGVVASTLAAICLGLDRTTTRNGIFGYNGLLVGAALATFSDPSGGAVGWAIAVISGAAFTTFLMKTLGVWWAKTVGTPPLTLPFNIVTLLCLALVNWFPQSWLPLKPALPILPSLAGLYWGELGKALPVGFGQVFLADNFIAGLLILLAVAICTPLGAAVGLLGAALNILAGILIGVTPETLYAGLWAYNGVLCAMAIGGVFYAPTLRSIAIGAGVAFGSGLFGGLLVLAFMPIGLPVLTMPFCLVTIAAFLILQRSLPSLVPVALHAVTSPEEHRQRYQAAQQVITNFRCQLADAIKGDRQFYLFDQAADTVKGDLRYVFNSIDTDQSGTLSTSELLAHLRQAGQVTSESELAYLVSRMDIDGSGSIDFAEFSELMLRHQRLMANYDEFVTYFLPIDADDDDLISLAEMNVAMTSVGEHQLQVQETNYLKARVGDHPLTWHRFIEMLLVT